MVLHLNLNVSSLNKKSIMIEMYFKVKIHFYLLINLNTTHKYICQSLSNIIINSHCVFNIPLSQVNFSNLGCT